MGSPVPAPSATADIDHGTKGGSCVRKIQKVMKEHKQGKLKSGRSGKTVKSRKQAGAIALSEARQSGAKIPKRKSKS